MIIAFHTVLNRKKNAIAICIFSIFSFSFSCIVEASQGLSDIYFYKMLIKDFLLIFASVGITSINQEVLKYNELHIKEFKMARTDKLTGLANRHYFEQKLIDEVNYSNRTGKPISVLIFDLDNFKRFNDTYGHVWGDKLLTLFSDIIKQNIRSTDIPVRYGGEEFLIILRDLDLVTARSVGERIRMQLEKQKIYIGEGEERRRATVSCGVAQYPKHSDNIKTVIDFADKALYKAKDSGKNIIVSYDEIENEQIDIESYLKT
jgi:diguanylate cyclase (GGDEF)-like protein